MVQAPKLIAEAPDGHVQQRTEAVRRVLLVDDSRAQRRIVAMSLERQGFDVIEAGSGGEALARLREGPVDLILSDWMMPGMDGLELCRQVRALPDDAYVYFILLTSKSEKGAVAQGLGIGADDFLTKPVSPEELRARIYAGDRILKMTRELSDKNRLIGATLDEISTLYDALDRDLIEARKMQQSLVRERARDFGPAQVSLLLKPSGHVGGDLVGFFEAGAGKIVVYSIDVSGHGIASALLTARLAGFLPEGAPEHNIALMRDLGGAVVPRPPAEVARLLNGLMLDDLKSDLYFTMVLGVLDLATGAVDLVQCGHPNPVLTRAGDLPGFHGQAGLPVGLIEGGAYTQWRLQLHPGDRLMFYSDGFTECSDAAGEMLDEEGFAALVHANNTLTGPAFFEALAWDLDAFHGDGDFSDDLSAALIEYQGPDHAE